MNSINRKIGIVSLGCKVNQYEARAIRETLEARGYTVTDGAGKCDAYIVNTCTVTAEADRKGRQVIRRLYAMNPDAYVLVTGCQAQANAEAIAAIPGVDYVCGNTKKMSVIDRLDDYFLHNRKKGTPEVDVRSFDGVCFEAMTIHASERTRAYVKIEDGCENKCSYCAIPGARGPIRSKQPDDVVGEVTSLIANGYHEIVLTGIETGSWGKDLGQLRLCDLLKRVDAIEGLDRLRLGSLDPSSVTKEFAQALSSMKSITPHFHLSLQSGSNDVLRGMKRKYNREMALHAFQLLRDSIPNVMFTTDVIVGFPGETEENFDETLSFVREIGFLTVHVFPYSRRAGTVAARMPDQVPDDVKKQRTQALIQTAQDIRRSIYERQIGTVQNVLFEAKTDGMFSGHTASFMEVRLKRYEGIDLHNTFGDVNVTGFTSDYLLGELSQK